MRRNLLINILYFIVVVIAFTLSLFKTDHQVWIMAWIGPVFMIRFMRNIKWKFGLIFGFLIIGISSSLGMLQFLLSTLNNDHMKDMDFASMGAENTLNGLLLLLFLIPFLLDKAFNKKVPKWASHLIFPSAWVSCELIHSYFRGTFYSLGQSQIMIPSVVMISSIFGIFGISFLISWFASIVNYLWDKKWDLRSLGLSGIVFSGIFGILLMYGSIITVFPKKAQMTVPMAGIILDCDFEERVFPHTVSLIDPESNPEEYINLIESPNVHIEEVREKTMNAAKHGAKLIIWQEYALTLSSVKADELLLEMRALADKENMYLLFSYARILSKQEIEKNNPKALKNLSVLLTPQGKIGWEYEKAFPIPGENLVVRNAPQEIPFIDTPYGRIGQVMCYDMHFQNYIHQAASKKIDILISPSYDGEAWTPLHTFNGGMRAVENGFTLVRITGDGHSGVIDPYFRLWSSQNSFEQDTDNFYYKVPILSFTTIHGVIGFIFPYCALLLLIITIMFAIINIYKKETDKFK